MALFEKTVMTEFYNCIRNIDANQRENRFYMDTVRTFKNGSDCKTGRA